MKPLVWIIGAVFLAGVLVAACFAAVNDEDSLGPVRLQLVSHERDCDWEGDCGGQYSSGGDYGHNRRDDRNRNRGAFSPGPFDRSPVDFSNSCISLDCSGREKDRRDQPPPDEDQPQALGCVVPVPYHCDPKPTSLFPPSFEGVKSFVLATIKSGIEMGRLFAETTITFVENLLFGIA